MFKSAAAHGNSPGSRSYHSTQICLSWEVGSYYTWKIRSLRYSWFMKAVHGGSFISTNPIEFRREGNSGIGEMPVCIFFLYFPPNPLNRCCENERGKLISYLYSCFLHGWLSSTEIKSRKGKGISSHTFFLYKFEKDFEEREKYTQYFTFLCGIKWTYLFPFISFLLTRSLEFLQSLNFETDLENVIFHLRTHHTNT